MNTTSTATKTTARIAAELAERGQRHLDQIKGPGCIYCNETGLVGYWPCRKCSEGRKP